MKKLTTALLTGSTLLLFTACGGGGSSSGGTTPPAPIYTSIQDLEFKTLNIAEVWKHDGSKIYETMKFTNNYLPTSDGSLVLMDNTSTPYYTKACMSTEAGAVTPKGEPIRYLCLGKFSSGSAIGWGISIDNGGIITGNFYFSSSGSISLIAQGVSSPDYSQGHLEGGVSTTVANNIDGVQIASASDSAEQDQSNITDDDKEQVYLDLAAEAEVNQIQTQSSEDISPELRQKFNKLYETLLQN